MTDGTKPASIAGLRQEIAGPGTDIFASIWVELLKPTDDVLEVQGAIKGLKIYDELERDPLANAVLTKRKLGLIARDWRVDSGGEQDRDRLAAELAERVLSGRFGLSFDKVCHDLLDATLKGHAVAEIVWEKRDAFIVPVAIKPKDQRRFVFDKDGTLRMLTRENTHAGIELPARKFVVHRFGDKTGDPYGRGLGHQLYWWVFFKRLATQFWLTFAEKFGGPTVMGEVPDHMTPEQELVLQAKLESIAQQSAVTVPIGTRITFLEAVRSGTVTYPDLVKYCDLMITICVLGETLTTSEGSSGSRALGDVHQGVKDEIIDADADLLSATLNTQLLSWITELNYPGAAPPSVWRPRPTREEAVAKTQQEQLKARDQARAFCDSMRRSGWEPEDFGANVLEQAFGDWKYVGPPQPASIDQSAEAGQPQALAAPAVAAPIPALAAPDARPTDHLADQLDGVASGAWAAHLNRIRRMLDQVETLEEAQFALADIYPDLKADDLAQAIGQAMALANLTGRTDVDG